MRAGVSAMLNAVKVLGTGKVDYVSSIILYHASGATITADSAVVLDLHTIHGISSGGDAFMMPAEELAAIRMTWSTRPPEGVTDIPSALEYQRKAARK